MANIAIIEYQSDIDEALDCFPPQDCLYLSVSAEASFHLSKRNIKFLTDEEVLTPAEFKEIGNENFEITENWIQQFEIILQSKDPIFQERGFYPFKWNFRRLKALLDAVRIRKVLLERLIDKEKPALIGVSIGANPARIHNQHLFFHKYDSLYGLLVQRIAKEKGIEIKIWAKIEPITKKPPAVDKMKAYLRTLGKGLKIVLESNNLFKRKGIRDNILLGSLCYDIEPLRQKLLDKFNFYYYKDLLCIRSLSSLLKLKAKKPDYESLEIDIKGIFKGLQITGDSIIDEILGNRIESYAERCIPVLWKGLNYLESLDDQKKFKAYIHHVGASDSFYALPVYYFSRKKKPFLVVQHGGGYGSGLVRQTEYCEFNHDGWFLSWGDGIKEIYEKRKKGNCKIVSTGSHLIEEIKKKSKPRKAISKVCYVPTLYRGYTTYYPDGQPCLDSRMFIMETNFLSALKPYMERYNISYKVAPWAVKESAIFGKNPMLVWIRENLPMIRIESRPLSSVIHKFDLFIIDFPSTTLLQALASGAEVLIYAGNPYYVLLANALKILQKRAIVGFDEDDFKCKIKSVLDKGLVVSDIGNTEFLEKYGIYLNDGKSLQRMVNQILACAGDIPC